MCRVQAVCSLSVPLVVKQEPQHPGSDYETPSWENYTKESVIALFLSLFLLSVDWKWISPKRHMCIIKRDILHHVPSCYARHHSDSDCTTTNPHLPPPKYSLSSTSSARVKQILLSELLDASFSLLDAAVWSSPDTRDTDETSSAHKTQQEAIFHPLQNMNSFLTGNSSKLCKVFMLSLYTTRPFPMKNKKKKKKKVPRVLCCMQKR